MFEDVTREVVRRIIGGLTDEHRYKVTISLYKVSVRDDKAAERFGNL